MSQIKETFVQGIGRRYANLCLKKADIPLSRRAGELSEEEVEKLVTIVQVMSYNMTIAFHIYHPPK